MQLDTLTNKGTRTKQRILDAALSLFETHGYEQTTVRAIATQADVALGNVYRYFDSKEDFVLAFYAQLAQRQNDQVTIEIKRHSNFRERLITCIRCKLAVVDQYHSFFGELFSVAARPGSPLNPFGQASRAVREAAVSSFDDVISGSAEKLPPDLRQELPWLLWLYSMGIILFWLHDTSAARYKTHHLIESTTDIIAKLIAVIGLPVLLPVRKPLIDLVRTLKSPS